MEKELDRLKKLVETGLPQDWLLAKLLIGNLSDEKRKELLEEAIKADKGVNNGTDNKRNKRSRIG